MEDAKFSYQAQNLIFFIIQARKQKKISTKSSNQIEYFLIAKNKDDPDEKRRRISIEEFFNLRKKRPGKSDEGGSMSAFFD